MSIYIHLQEDDGGQYRCTARNEAGEVSLTMNLDIASPISVGKVSFQPTTITYENIQTETFPLVHSMYYC